MEVDFDEDDEVLVFVAVCGGALRVIVVGPLSPIEVLTVKPAARVAVLEVDEEDTAAVGGLNFTVVGLLSPMDVETVKPTLGLGEVDSVAEHALGDPSTRTP